MRTRTCWTITDYLAGEVPANARLHCPFHDDSRPSATVLPGSGRLMCFACGLAADRLGVAARLLFGPEVTPTTLDVARHHLARQGITLPPRPQSAMPLGLRRWTPWSWRR